jgi:hypothetical protein
VSYGSDIAAASSRWGVPAQVLSWQLNQESGMNPAAYNPASGSTGIAQFLPSTAAQFGIDPTDPAASINAAAQYDAQLYGQTGSWTGALQRYGTLANVPPSVWQSWQPVAQSVGETGTAGAGGTAGGGGTSYNPFTYQFWHPFAGGVTPANPNWWSPNAPMGGGSTFSGIAEGFGLTSISRWQEIAVRVAVGALGVLFLFSGFFLAGRRGPAVLNQLARGLPGAGHL